MPLEGCHFTRHLCEAGEVSALSSYEDNLNLSMNNQFSEQFFSEPIIEF